VAGGSSWCPGAIQHHHRVVTCYPPSEQSCAGIEVGGSIEEGVDVPEVPI